MLLCLGSRVLGREMDYFLSLCAGIYRRRCTGSCSRSRIGLLVKGSRIGSRSAAQLGRSCSCYCPVLISMSYLFKGFVHFLLEVLVRRLWAHFEDFDELVVEELLPF